MNDIGGFNANNTSVNDQLLAYLLNDSLVMRYFGREFASESHLLPFLSFNIGALIRLDVESWVVQIVDTELPHITKASLFEVLSTIYIQPIKLK